MKPAIRMRDIARLGCALLLGLAFAGGLTGTAHANWAANGVAVGTGSDSQIFPMTCTDGAGGAIVVWRQYATPESPEQIYAQRLDASGNALWTAGGVHVAPGIGTQRVPMLLPMAGGGVMIAWEDNRSGNFDIYVQRLTGTGTVAAGWPAGGLALSYFLYPEVDPVIVSDGSDGAFVAWDLVYSATDWDIYAGHVLGNGTKDAGWPAGGLGVCTNGRWQDYPYALSDRAGGVFIAWRDSNVTTHETDVYATRLLSSGANASGWTSGGTGVCTASGRQGVPSLVADGSDGFIAAWRDMRTDTDGDIYAMRMSGSASELWTHNGVAVCTASHAQGDNWRVAMVSDDVGQALLAWPDDRLTGTGSFDVYAQRLDPWGGVMWTADGVKLCGATGVQGLVRACGDGAGGAVVAWEDQRSGIDIYGQHVGYDGHVAWPLDGLAFSTATGSQGWPEVTLDGAGGGIVAWMDTRNGTTDIYAGQLTGFPNVVANIAPVGWDAPAVPREDAGAVPGSVHVSPHLTGNFNLTWINFQTNVTGPNPTPQFYVEGLIDDKFGRIVDFPNGFSPYWWTGLNLGPLEVTGGRHTLSVEADSWYTLPESDEADNVYLAQWVWSPHAMIPDTPLERTIPTEWGWMPLPNTDGMFYPRCDMTTAWVTSVVSRDAGTDCDLYMFDDYANSTSGFSNMVGLSTLGGRTTDFVVGHYLSPQTILYPGVCRYGPVWTGTYYIEASEAVNHQGPAAPMRWGPVAWAAGRLADVYELYMAGGTTHYVAVGRQSGTSTLELGLFPASPQGGIYGRADAIAMSSPFNATEAQLVFTAPAAGWYPLVVYRTTGDAAGEAMSYTLAWDTHPLVDVPDGPVAPAVLSFAGARPNPMRTTTTLAFSLSRRGPVRLEIFDVRGRRVRLIAQEDMDAGPHALEWDGRTDAGAIAPAGLTWARLSAEGRVLVQRIALVR